VAGWVASAEYEVTALRYGTRTARSSEVFLHFELYREPDRELAMDYFLWVARNADRTVVIDCGFNERSGARRNRTMLCPPVEALRQIGVEAAEVSQLIVTHAHYDHIGNLLSFPAARILIADREFAFWTSALSRKPLFMTSAEETDLDALRQLADTGRVDFISDRASVAPGIEAVEIGGHTPGQLAVIIGTGQGETVIASDALHYYQEMTQDRPFAHVTDVPAMYAGFAWLREQAAAGREIVAGHDPQVMQRYPAVTGAAGLAVKVG
jgi:glyoxylase-like metal-dependent hydrolase (beta-lactamase superfamily II)